MRPPSAFTSERTTSMPMPRPDSSVTCSAVEKPGHEDQVGRFVLTQGTCRLLISTLLQSPLARMRRQVQTAPSSRNSTDTSLPSWRRSRS
jgi:hypothetical protein